LVQRARIRYRVFRLADARSDLSQARALAERLALPTLSGVIAFDEGTVCDWSGDFRALDEPDERCAAAAAAERGANLPLLRALGCVSGGRRAWRRGEVVSAIEQLEQGVTLIESLAPDSAPPELRIIGLLLLSCALVQAQRSDAAAPLFDEVIALAESAGDALHLCAALGNRAFLWSARGEVQRCVADLSRACEIARQLGHPWTERNALINLAEVLYWAGREEEALPLLARARLLEERFGERPVYEAALLLARIHTVKSAPAALEHLDWLHRHHLPDPSAANAMALFSAAFRVASAGAAAALPEAGNELMSWAEIERRSGDFLVDERAELAYFRARASLVDEREPLAGEILAEARRVTAHHPAWAQRLRALESKHN
jgi:tetratricopeptide (TPR) repeat protein